MHREPGDTQEVVLQKSVVRDGSKVCRVRPGRDEITLLTAFQRHVLSNRLWRDDDSGGVFSSVGDGSFESERMLPNLRDTSP